MLVFEFAVRVGGFSALEPMTALLIAAIVYWVLTIMFTFLQAWMERRLARSDR